MESISVFFEQMRLNRAINLTHMTCSLAAEPITGKQAKKINTTTKEQAFKTQHVVQNTENNFMISVSGSKALKPIVWGSNSVIAYRLLDRFAFLF